MEDVKELCERVIIIDHGKILYDGKLENIVKEYAKNKFLSIDFSTTVERSKLEKLGNIKEYSETFAVIVVERTKSNKVAAKLLESFPVKDLNIEEPNIEDIIRDVFTKK